MSFMFSPSSVTRSFHAHQFPLPDFRLIANFSSEPNSISFHGKTRQAPLPSNGNTIRLIFKRNPANTLRFIARECLNSNDAFVEDSTLMYDVGDHQLGEEEVEDTGTPWEGAVVYERSPSITHVEYCTTLERLGMGNLSTDVSRNRASVMGLRVTKAVKDFPLGTPVLISVDVTRKKHKVRLDGIVRTVLTLYCNRCGEQTAESVFSNFSLVLTEEAIEEPEVINLGVIYGEDRSRTSSGEDEDDNDSSVDLDDWLYFPPEQRKIDISKHIRDMVHIEITINAICDGQCKGLCLKCGSNLNTGSCSCSKQKATAKSYGPLAGLKEQMNKR